MQTRAANRSARARAAGTEDRLDEAILWITLAALFLIPLVFSYFDVVAVFNELKVVTLHLTAGLIAILWLWQIVLRRLDARTSTNNQLNWDLLGWAGKNPARWALIAAAVWVFAQLASTLLSALPVISFFGGDEARSGYNLYDSLSLTVIFLSVALRFRTLRTLELLGYTLVLTGTIAAVYGIAQHFGWDPIGGNAGRTRVIASFGNTLNFGGYMVMSIPATLALVSKRFGRKWLWLAILVGALGLQIAGIWFSGGRGPFVAIAASLLTFFVISVALGTTKETLRSAVVLAVSAIIAAVVIALPSAQGDIGLERALSIGDQFSSGGSSTDIEGGLQGRFDIWESSLRLATTWDVPIEEPAVNSLLRPLFGLGPDMYVYSFPFVGPSQSKLSLVDHAHNYEIQILMEQGFVGLIGFSALAGLLVISAFAIVRRYRRAGRGLDSIGVLLIMLVPANIGKMFELQTGVARVSDLAMTLALFGATIALYEVANRRLTAEESAEPAQSSKPKRNPASLSASNQTMLASSLLAAIAITAVVITIFISWDLRRLSASRNLAIGHDDPNLNVRAQAWADAQSEAPERESFTFNLFEQYLEVANEQHALGNEEEALRLLNIGRNMLLEYEKRDPLELDTQIGLSKTVSTLATWGFLEYSQELADRSIKLAETYPSYPTLLGTASTAMTSVGLHELAIKYADLAIATEATTRPWAKAWYGKGRALYALGREDEAIATLITATEKDPVAEGALLAHQVLAQIYKTNGDIDLYKQHTKLGGGVITAQE
jgi:tetratricopeptide (TPR) repeat protein